MKTSYWDFEETRGCSSFFGLCILGTVVSEMSHVRKTYPYIEMRKGCLYTEPTAEAERYSHRRTLEPCSCGPRPQSQEHCRTSREMLDTCGLVPQFSLLFLPILLELLVCSLEVLYVVDQAHLGEGFSFLYKEVLLRKWLRRARSIAQSQNP